MCNSGQGGKQLSASSKHFMHHAPSPPHNPPLTTLSPKPCRSLKHIPQTRGAFSALWLALPAPTSAYLFSSTSSLVKYLTVCAQVHGGEARHASDRSCDTVTMCRAQLGATTARPGMRCLLALGHQSAMQAVHLNAAAEGPPVMRPLRWLAPVRPALALGPSSLPRQAPEPWTLDPLTSQLSSASVTRALAALLVAFILRGWGGRGVSGRGCLAGCLRRGSTAPTGATCVLDPLHRHPPQLCTVTCA